jgi:hypothetical protein
VRSVAREHARHSSGRGASARVPIRARATAEILPDAGAGGLSDASGGGYDGPLAYRQGKPMRPDVALAFDRLAAAARDEAGLFLSISSGFRSDAEQARLFAAQADPHLFSVDPRLAAARRRLILSALRGTIGEAKRDGEGRSRTGSRVAARLG